MELIIENVRCFAGRHVVPIKPLTILVGENSTGKSTLMALMSIVADGKLFPDSPDFNAAPYYLGVYDTIATNRGGNNGQESNFSMGFANTAKDVEYRIIATYANIDGVATLSRLLFNFLDDSFLFQRNERGEWRYEGTGDIEQFSSYVGKDGSGVLGPFYDIWKEYVGESSSIGEGVYPFALFALRYISRDQVKTRSIAPIRTKPRRTYEYIKEGYNPEGDHIPFVLSSTKGKERNSLDKYFKEYGQQSGLFSTISIRKLGDKKNDPYQIMVQMEGESPVNIRDMGYGVSQTLPILAESVLAEQDSYLLMQQPEVHLHPKAQAALGSLFVNLTSKLKKKFVIETHSDYIIDRIRQHVAKGDIAHKNVQILYFEKKKVETEIRVLELDKRGNVKNPPLGYRDFFLQEELNLLGRTS